MQNSPKRLLLFTSKLGYQTRSFEEAARKLDVQLVYVTDRCHQLKDPWGDQAIAVHFDAPEVAAYSVIEAARSQPIHGILTLGDHPVVPAAYAARGLGLTGNHPASVEACRNKLRMKEVFLDAGLRVPWFRKVPLHPAPEPALLGITYPCVLKPLSLSASQGVIRANNREEFLAASDRIRRLLDSPEVRVSREANLDHLLIEGYIPGVEVSVEGLLTDGVLRILAIFDKPDPLEGPYFEETIYVTPSRLSEHQQRAVEECVRNSVRALGLSHGPIHAEFRINEAGVWPIEVAPRPIGGLCGRSLRFSLESQAEPMALEELLLRHALELPGKDSSREDLACAVMMIPVPASGMFERIGGQEEALATAGITELLITARIHDYIAAWPEGSSYLGFLFARGQNPETVEHAIREAHQKLTFTITPRLSVEHPAARRASTEGN